MKAQKFITNRMIVKNGGILIFTILFLGISCNSTSQKKNKKTDELKEEVQDVREELDEMIASEKKEIRNELDSVIVDFNIQLSILEGKLESKNKELSAETKEMLDALKAQRDTLKVRLDDIENQAENEWESFKEELRHDMKQFSSSVVDFFIENK